jgi:hypothetical protein
LWRVRGAYKQACLSQTFVLKAPVLAFSRGGQIYRAHMHGAVVAVKALYSQLMTGNIDELKHEV